MKRINDILYAVAFTVVVVLGLSFAAYAAYNSVQTYKSRSWPSVSGTVIYSRTEVVVRRSGNGKRPVIKYRYDVNGTEYVGDRIAFAHAFDTEEYAEGKAADYPVGKKVVVHYNPTDPSLSCLEIDQSLLGNVFMAAAGVLLISLGSYFLLTMICGTRWKK